jgi:hypothetical protein
MTAVEWLIEELRGAHVKGDFIFNGVITSELIEQAKAMEKEEKIEFACQVAEVSAEKYIQGKTTRMIAEELIKSE